MYTSVFSERISALNKVLGDRNSTDKEKSKMKDALQNAVNEFNVEVRNVDFDTFLGTENPMYSACLACFHTFATLKITKDKVTNVEEASIGTKKEVVDLKALERYNKEQQLANNGQWPFWVARFAQLLTGSAVKDVGADYERFKTKYAISTTAENVQFKAKNPVSNTSMAETLQEIVDAIVFVDNGKGLNTLKVKNCDAKYVHSAFTKDSNKGVGLDTKSASQMEKVITKMIHHLITGDPYIVNYREKKDR